MDKNKYYNRVRVVLADKMIKKSYLAEQLHVSNMTVSRWCSNSTQPTAPQLMEISKLLNCKLEDLFESIN